MTPDILTTADLAAIAERWTKPALSYGDEAIRAGRADTDVPSLLATVAHWRERAERAEEEETAVRKELTEAYWTITGMRVQIREWIDEGVSRPDMAAFLKENAG